MLRENKSIVERFYSEVVNGGNLALANELMAHDYIEHGNPAGSGIEGFKQFVSGLASAFPDLRITIEELIAEGDKVVARVTVRATHKGTFMGSIPPTGKEVTFTGVDIFQIGDSKIIGRWNQRDLLGLLRQLGVATLPG
ncbi:MAG: ester cyclase [Anaerolineae bacterium]|nr:ester cyclase [Anaerolineae bacterium]